MFKIIIAEFVHETNTFSNQKTDKECFKRCTYVLGDSMITEFSTIESEVGGFLKVLKNEPDVMLIPVVSARAVPSGRVTRDMFDDIKDRITDAISTAGKVDGVLLSLHGAMVTEDSEDAEGDLLEAIRKAAGNDTIIMVTLDLHSNITQKMVANCDALFNIDYYPHTDFYKCGIETADVMLKTLRGKLKPVMRYSKKPLVLCNMATSHPVMQKHVNSMHEYEKNPKVISVSISHGFYCADIYEMGMSVITVTDGDPELAQSIADELCCKIWDDRANLTRELYSADEAIKKAISIPGGPIILSDGADNPGGGSTGDGTHLLRALIEHKVQNVAFAMIVDAESVAMAEKAGVGSMVDLKLGGKLRPEILGQPIECTAYVKTLSDGKYVVKGPVGRGFKIDLMKTAVVVIDGIEVIITSNVSQPTDAQFFRAFGIEPKDKKIVVVKSGVHFRADFEPLAKMVIDVDCPGLNSLDPRNLKYKRCKRPIYPLDNI